MKILFFLILLAASISILNAQDCPTDQDYAVNGYEPYAVQYNQSEEVNLEKIANELSENYDQIESIKIVGHSAIYGNSDIQQASLDRAERVNDRLIELIDNRLGDSDHNFQYLGKGGDCPLVANDTQNNRDTNRRVYIYVSYYDESTENDSSKLPKKSVSPPSFNKALLKTRLNTKDKTLKCMLSNVRVEGTDSRYLTANTINRILSDENKAKANKKVNQHTIDLRKQLVKNYKRLKKKYEGEELISKFAKASKKKKRKLFQAINMLDSQANCQDENIIAMRRWVVRQSNNDNSLYHCKKINRRIQEMMQSIGGKIKGCG